jgi:hypothetical protein
MAEGTCLGFVPIRTGVYAIAIIQANFIHDVFDSELYICLENGIITQILRQLTYRLCTRASVWGIKSTKALRDGTWLSTCTSPSTVWVSWLLPCSLLDSGV